MFAVGVAGDKACCRRLTRLQSHNQRLRFMADEISQNIKFTYPDSNLSTLLAGDQPSHAKVGSSGGECKRQLFNYLFN